MIKSNLAVLMAERGLKMVDVIEQTGIAKATIQGLYHNSNKAIHYHTIDVLCDYFNVSVGELLLRTKFETELVSVEKLHPLQLKYNIRIRINDNITEYSKIAEVLPSENDQESPDTIVISLRFGKDFNDLIRFVPFQSLIDHLMDIVIEGAIIVLEIDRAKIVPNITMLPERSPPSFP